MFQFLLPMALNAAVGVHQARRQAEQQKQNNLAQAEMTRYSPWTGQSGQLDMDYRPGALERGVSGAVTGLGIGQSIDKAFMQQPASPVANLDAGQSQVYNAIAKPKPMNQWEMLAGQPYQRSLFNVG